MDLDCSLSILDMLRRRSSLWKVGEWRVRERGRENESEQVKAKGKLSRCDETQWKLVNLEISGTLRGSGHEYYIQVHNRCSHYFLKKISNEHQATNFHF